MSERHRAVIALRWAGIDGEPMTLRQVGRLLGLSAERVRKNERDAMAYMSDRIDGPWWGGEGWRASAKCYRGSRRPEAAPRAPVPNPRASEEAMDRESCQARGLQLPAVVPTGQIEPVARRLPRGSGVCQGGHAVSGRGD